MAITKLMHMKEAPGIPHVHLRNAIDYILDVRHGGKKTEYGQLVGGNSGLDHKEILNNFIETKQLYGKIQGRQGYHFVISFARGETDKETAYRIVQEFCESFLGDGYDHVFAIHNDKKHLHGHIVFNSVSRMDGYKYHYKKGDWEKNIQPITDRICQEHGLDPLTFDDERVGLSYAFWAAAHDGKYNWTDIIRADVDFAIQQAKSFEEFQEIMGRMDYQMRFGYSKKHGSSYITFSFTDPDGKVHRRRSYKLAKTGYSPKEIAGRIRSKEGSRLYEDIMMRNEKRAAVYLKSAVLKSTRTYFRLYQAVNYYRLPNPYAVPAGRVRRDILRLDLLLEECRYLKAAKSAGRDVLERRAQNMEQRIAYIKAERTTSYRILSDIGKDKQMLMERYGALQREMIRAEQMGSDRFEEIEDEMAAMEAELPRGILEVKDRVQDYNKELSALQKELRILKRILETEQGKGAVNLEPKQ